MEFPDAFAKQMAVAPLQEHRALCREQLFYLVFERHPHAGGPIVDRIMASGTNIPDLLELLRNEKKLIEREQIILRECADDPAFQLLAVKNANPSYPALQDSKNRPPAGYLPVEQRDERSPSAIPELSVSTKRDETLDELLFSPQSQATGVGNPLDRARPRRRSLFLS